MEDDESLHELQTPAMKDVARRLLSKLATSCLSRTAKAAKTSAKVNSLLNDPSFQQVRIAIETIFWRKGQSIGWLCVWCWEIDDFNVLWLNYSHTFDICYIYIYIFRWPGQSLEWCRGSHWPWRWSLPGWGRCHWPRLALHAAAQPWCRVRWLPTVQAVHAIWEPRRGSTYGAGLSMKHSLIY